MPFNRGSQESFAFHAAPPGGGLSGNRQEKKREETPEFINAELILQMILNPLYNPEGRGPRREDMSNQVYEEKRNFWLFQAWKMLNETEVKDRKIEVELQKVLKGFRWEDRAYEYIVKQPELRERYGVIFRKKKG